MKKLLAALTVVAFVFIASSAMATTAKVPKNLCLDFNSYNDTHQLAFKALGTLFDPSAKVTTYSISGIDYNGYWGPVSGSGYVIPGTTTLHATFSGKFGGSAQVTLEYELFFNLATGTGTEYFMASGTLGVFNSGADTVTGIDCKGLSVPTGTDESGPDMNSITSKQ